MNSSSTTQPISSAPTAQSKPASSNFGKYTLVALGVLSVIVGLAATAIFYTQLGYWSFTIGGGGLVIGLLLISSLALCRERSTSSPERPILKNATPEKSVGQTTSLKPGNLKGDSETSLHPPHLNKSTLVPTQASAIDLPLYRPKEIPAGWNLTIEEGKKWLTYSHLHRYATYLALSSPIAICNATKRRELFRLGHSSEHSIEDLEAFIFDYLPTEFSNIRELNIPFFLYVSDNHWALVYIDRERRRVEYYDSKMYYGNHNEIVEKLTGIATRLSQEEPQKAPYTFVSKIQKVLQPDSYDCGSWVLFFLEYRLMDPDFNFNQLDMKKTRDLMIKYREKVTYKLVEMNEAEKFIANKEDKEYRAYYSPCAKTAREKRTEAIKKIPYLERWRQTLSRISLVPGQ